MVHLLHLVWVWFWSFFWSSELDLQTLSTKVTLDSEWMTTNNTQSLTSTPIIPLCLWAASGSVQFKRDSGSHEHRYSDSMLLWPRIPPSSLMILGEEGRESVEMLIRTSVATSLQTTLSDSESPNILQNKCYVKIWWRYSIHLVIYALWHTTLWFRVSLGKPDSHKSYVRASFWLLCVQRDPIYSSWCILEVLQVMSGSFCTKNLVH